jgi:hypothetical protein
MPSACTASFPKAHSGFSASIICTSSLRLSPEGGGGDLRLIDEIPAFVCLFIRFFSVSVQIGLYLERFARCVVP